MKRISSSSGAPSRSAAMRGRLRSGKAFRSLHGDSGRRRRYPGKHARISDVRVHVSWWCTLIGQVLQGMQHVACSVGEDGWCVCVFPERSHCQLGTRLDLWLLGDWVQA